MSVWHPPPFIPPHMEDTEMQGAYQQSRTKGSLLVGGREEGVRVDGMRKFLSSYCTLWYQPRRHTDSCRAGTYYDILSKKPLAKMPNTSDENLTYCSETMWEIHKSLLQLSQSRTSNSLFISQDDRMIYCKMWT